MAGGALRRLVVVIFGAVVGVVAAEVTLRVLGAPLLPIWMPGLSGRGAFVDRDEGFWFSNNDLGYREQSFSAQRSESSLRVVVCGDSHAYGIGVDQDQRVTEIIEARMPRLFGRPVEVLNLAYSGLTLDYYAECHRLAVTLGAEITVVLVYGGNDLGELLAPRTVRPLARSKGLVLPLVRRAHLWHLLRGFPSRPPPEKVEQGLLDCVYALRSPDVGPFAQSLLQACLLRTESRQKQALDGASVLSRQLCGAQDVVFGLVPSALLAQAPGSEEQVRDLTVRLGIQGADPWATEETFAMGISEACASAGAGAALVDFTSILRATEDAYFPRDWHLAAPGHAAVGGALMAPLEKAIHRATSSPR